MAMALAALFAGPIVAQDDDDPASKSVSLEVTNQTLLDALKLLFKSVGANFVLEPGVMRGAANVKVDLSITNQPFLQALENVLAAGTQKGTGLTYRLENGVYTITTKDGAGGAPPAVAPNPVRPPRGSGTVPASKSRVSLSLQGKKLDEALRSVFDAADTQFVIPLRAPATGTVTMSMTNMPFEGALLGTLKAVELGQPLGWQEVGSGIYAVVPLPGGRAPSPENVRLSLNFSGGGLRDALAGVFRASGAAFNVAPAIQNSPVNLKLHDVTMKSAVDMLVKSSGHPNYVMVNEVGVYKVAVKGR
jgi:type II secretory pathway component GspD/PulD (secretin)